MNLTLSRRSFGSSSCSQTSRPGGKMPPGLCRDDAEASYCGRDYEGVATAYGGGQSRSKAVWGWSVGRGGACSVTCPNTP